MKTQGSQKWISECFLEKENDHPSFKKKKDKVQKATFYFKAGHSYWLPHTSNDTLLCS